MVVVRVATPVDAPAIGTVHVRAWRAAYAGLMPQTYLDELDPAARVERWLQVLSTQAEHEGTVLVAVVDDEVVGFAAVGPSPVDDAPTADGPVGAVFAIYLLPAFWGRGIGRRLLAAARDRLREKGFCAAVLWVLDTNERGRRFYARNGWAPDGATQVDTSFGFPLSEVRYRLDLCAAPSAPATPQPPAGPAC